MINRNEQSTLIANMQYTARLAYILRTKGAAEMLKIIQEKANVKAK